MLEKEGGDKKKPLLPNVTDSKLFGHEGDAESAEKLQTPDTPADTREDWHGPADTYEDNLNKDQKKEAEKSQAQKDERDELKNRRPE
jgi:hypothetical protein